MMGRLLKMHIYETSLASVLTGSSLSKKTSDEWMGIYFKGDKIGYSHSAFGPEGDYFRLDEQTYLEIHAQGVPMKISMKINALTNTDFTLKSFDFELQSGLVTTEIKGEVKGLDLELNLRTVGKTSTQTIHLKKAPVLPGSLQAILKGKQLSVGQKFIVPVFDPGTMSSSDLIVEVEKEDAVEIHGEKFPAYQLTSTYAGISIGIWVDSEGQILKQTTPLGWVMLREAKNQALTQGWTAGPKVDLVTANSVKAIGKSITSPEKATYLIALINFNSTDGLDLNGGRQYYTPRPTATVRVRQEDLTGFEIPDLPVTQAEMEPYRKPDLFVQSDHPDIVAQAKRIIGDEKNSLNAARLILAWVYEHIEKRAVASLPNSLEVLQTRVGDCNEHTVLYVALARAVGLPAKICVGLVLVDRSFYYHAWPEIYVGRWVAVDPVFNQFPADATHIRLITGGIDKQIEIVRIMCKLRDIVILDVQ
jgi:hypothetical protein